MAILKIRDADGTVREIIALKGDKGDPGEFTGGELLKAHINDKNNPHGMSAEQIGARPNTWIPTAAEVGARPDTWIPTAAEVGARPDTWIPTAAEVGARPDTWMPTAADVGAAPAGYGLGNIAVKKLSTKDDLDSLLNSGIYTVQLTTGGFIASGYWLTYALVAVDAYNDNCVIQTIKSVQSDDVLRRTRTDGVWSDWRKTLTSANFSYDNSTGTLTITV